MVIGPILSDIVILATGVCQVDEDNFAMKTANHFRSIAMNQAIRRALIVIDVQNEYVDGNLPIEYPEIGLSLGNIGKAMDAARELDIPIMAIQQVAPATSPIFAEGSRGQALHTVVTSRACADVIRKKLPNAFTDTTLADCLQQHDINTLVVTGYMTQNCVDATIRHAFHYGYQVEFLHDAAGTLSYQNRSGFISAEDMHRSFCIVLQSRFAAVMSTDEWLRMLAGDGPAIRDSVYQSAQAARGRQ
jgi:nicotinamidase-related amidase